MPRLTSIDGVDVYTYFKDHAPPHVHAMYGDSEVLVKLVDGEVYAGGIPGPKLDAVRTYLRANLDPLLAQWRLYGGG